VQFILEDLVIEDVLFFELVSIISVLELLVVTLYLFQVILTCYFTTEYASLNLLSPKLSSKISRNSSKLSALSTCFNVSIYSEGG